MQDFDYDCSLVKQNYILQIILLQVMSDGTLSMCSYILHRTMTSI
jgi:hypothetical protein